MKLTVHAEGSQGADTKHKVFWVTGCGGTQPNTPPTTPPTEPPGGPPQQPPRGGTAAGNPPVTSLPDTASSAGQPAVMLLAGLGFLGGSTTLAVVRVRSRSRRR